MLEGGKRVWDGRAVSGCSRWWMIADDVDENENEEVEVEVQVQRRRRRG